MADDLEKDDTSKQHVDPVTVASLNVPKLIIALHQKALAEANASSQNLRIVNSAIDDKNNESKLQSTGEHIISVIPIDKGAKVEKKVAVELLKKYVQWFIGPDLANKVDNSTVMSLKQSPLKENRRFMSFQQFLLEEADAKEGDDKTKQQNDLGDTLGKNEQTSQPDKKNDAKDDSKGSGDEQDENVTSDVGYYLPYNLKVEGLKQTALKDAVKKFASTFFDDVTFKSSGLFGGGDSFSIKDAKDKWRDAFGPIDPDDLVDKVRKQIEDISHPNAGDPPIVKIRDRKTLISDLGKAINGKEKQMIDQAKYSLWISLREYDPKKPLFNRRVVADIVTSSMKGLWKKFKNKITKDDVIFLEDYVDTHEDTKALRDLQELIPDVPEILAFINKASNAADAFNKIKNKIDAVIKHKQMNNSSIAQACIKVWNQFSDTHKSSEEQSRMTSLTHDKKKDFFQKFIAAYKKAYDKYYDKSLRESLDILYKMTYIVNVKKLVLESLFNEADDNKDSKEAKEEKNISFNKIKQYAQQYVTPKPNNIFVDYKSTLIKMCDILDVKNIDFDKAFGEFKHGILVDYTGQIDEQKSLSESIKNDIFGILNLNQIQEDENKKNDSGSNDGKKTNDKEAVDKNKLKNALLKALEKNGIAPDDCGELFEIVPVVINESKLSDYIEKKNLSKEDALKPETIEDLKKNVFQKKGTEFIQDKINKYFGKKTSSKNAYILPFGKDDLQPGPDDKFTDDDDDEGHGRTDLYIVPIKNMNYKDKEYDTYA